MPSKNSKVLRYWFESRQPILVQSSAARKFNRAFLTLPRSHRVEITLAISSGAAILAA
jgi:hypothetical protein